MPVEYRTIGLDGKYLVDLLCTSWFSSFHTLGNRAARLQPVFSIYITCS